MLLTLWLIQLKRCLFQPNWQNNKEILYSFILIVIDLLQEEEYH